jgi:hypothetical protein
MIRFAKEKDIPKICDLLSQVCLVHHNGRPDIKVKLIKGKIEAESWASLLSSRIFAVSMQLVLARWSNISKSTEFTKKTCLIITENKSIG